MKKWIFLGALALGLNGAMAATPQAAVDRSSPVTSTTEPVPKVHQAKKAKAKPAKRASKHSAARKRPAGKKRHR